MTKHRSVAIGLAIGFVAALAVFGISRLASRNEGNLVQTRALPEALAPRSSAEPVASRTPIPATDSLSNWLQPTIEPDALAEQISEIFR